MAAADEDVGEQRVQLEVVPDSADPHLEAGPGRPVQHHEGLVVQYRQGVGEALEVVPLQGRQLTAGGEERGRVAAAHVGAAAQHGQRGRLPLVDRAPGQRQPRGFVHIVAEAGQQRVVNGLRVRLRKFFVGRTGGGPASGEPAAHPYRPPSAVRRHDPSRRCAAT
ncbi:hypothetical protein [Streptomyces sp. NRRL S-448]|uniref:hypothetical protein n=1 Tax=Streptomyces sp. NRRL S-448 TaxID=1463907 RepID=UPI00356AE8AE